MKTMVKSDGNGSYVVDRKLWGFLMLVVTILAGLVVYGGQNAITNLETIRDTVSRNQAYDEQQEARIFILEKQLDRIEAKLDQALSRK
jgi:hypothetical protein